MMKKNEEASNANGFNVRTCKTMLISTLHVCLSFISQQDMLCSCFFFGSVVWISEGLDLY